MGIAREDESLDPFGLIGAQFGEDLIGVADNRRAAARASAADAGPQVLLNEAIAVPVAASTKVQPAAFARVENFKSCLIIIFPFG